jgi:sec-independent protein translocase protein TatB
VFGFSFGEILVISLVTLVAVGPQKLPGMLKTMGQWARKLRQMTMDVRQQTGIDEMLRAEGIQLSELRTLMRGYHGGFPGPAPASAPTATAPVTSTPRYEDPYQGLEPDPTREYPLEGADAYGALPDDLLEPAASTEVGAAPGAPAPKEPDPVAKSEPAAATVPAKPDSLPEIEPEPEPVVVKPPLESKPPSAPVRSVPPPPPRRSGPPRPAPSAPLAAAKPEAPAAPTPPASGSANGNG